MVQSFQRIQVWFSKRNFFFFWVTDSLAFATEGVWCRGLVTEWREKPRSQTGGQRSNSGTTKNYATPKMSIVLRSRSNILKRIRGGQCRQDPRPGSSRRRGQSSRMRSCGGGAASVSEAVGDERKGQEYFAISSCPASCQGPPVTKFNWKPAVMDAQKTACKAGHSTGQSCDGRGLDLGHR